MYGEAAGVDTEADGVVDERERHYCEQQRYRKQHDAYLGDVGIYAVYQVLLILHFTHFRIAFQLARDDLQRVGVGIVGIQRYFYRRKEGIGVGKLARIGSERLDALAQCLLLTYIVEAADVRPLLQSGAELTCLARRHVVLKHQCHHNILFNIRREVARSEHREHNQTQQYQHHSRAYAQRYCLQSVTTAGLFPSFCHFSKGYIIPNFLQNNKKKTGTASN